MFEAIIRFGDALRFDTFLQYGNSAACIFMMGFLLMAASLTPSRGMWGSRISIGALAGYLAIQATAPWEPTLPNFPWYVCLTHIHGALVLIVCRHDIMTYLRRAFSKDPTKLRERDSDHMPLVGRADYRNVSGAGPRD